jgi:hypothetical protein
MQLLALATALFLSGVAAYYSIIGLTLIFSGAFLSILLMGSALEIAKLVSVSWLYRNWARCNFLMKGYMLTSILVLMLITSMGIFGYLSRAHLESSSLNTSSIAAEIQTIDETIESKELTKQLYLTQIQTIDNSLVRYIELGSVSRGLQERKNLEVERKELEENRIKVDSEILSLKAQKNKLNVELQKLEVEIGPLKYIAELIYGENAENHFDSAVRWVIILLVLVFDPLAIVLLIAANMNFNERDVAAKKKPKPIKKSKKNEYVEVHKATILDAKNF